MHWISLQRGFPIWSYDFVTIFIVGCSQSNVDGPALRARHCMAYDSWGLLEYKWGKPCPKFAHLMRYRLSYLSVLFSLIPEALFPFKCICSARYCTLDIDIHDSNLEVCRSKLRDICETGASGRLTLSEVKSDGNSLTTTVVEEHLVVPHFLWIGT